MHLQLQLDSNTLNPIYSSHNSVECGFFNSVDDLESAKTCLATTHWGSDNADVIGAGKALMIKLCQLVVMDESNWTSNDLAVVGLLFPNKGTKNTKTKVKIVDEYDSYEGLVKVAGLLNA